MRKMATIFMLIGVLSVGVLGCKKKPADKDKGGAGMSTEKAATMDPAGMPAPGMTPIAAMDSGDFKITLKPDTGIGPCDDVIRAHICYWNSQWKKVMASYKDRKNEHDLFAAAVAQQQRRGNAEWKKKMGVECAKKLAGLKKVGGFENCVK